MSLLSMSCCLVYVLKTREVKTNIYYYFITKCFQEWASLHNEKKNCGTGHLKIVFYQHFHLFLSILLSILNRILHESRNVTNPFTNSLVHRVIYSFQVYWMTTRFQALKDLGEVPNSSSAWGTNANAYQHQLETTDGKEPGSMCE